MNSETDQERERELSVVSFLSGKGGSGKTTVALSIAKLLADVGLKVLLVDFDLSTSGASYFFLPIFNEKKNKGLAEVVDEYGETWDYSKAFFEGITLSVGDNFDFIPSRVALSKSPVVNLAANAGKEFFVEKILEPLIDASRQYYDYVLIDNQAGYSNTSASAAKVADKAVIVAESDRISSDAVDNLLALTGSDMPKFRRYLINKVDIKEGDYQKKAEAFRAMNRLPPLPFDFSVRDAFGQREIPVDLNKPTSFLIALFATVKEIFPERKHILEEYEDERITKLFDAYQTELNGLIERRKQIQDRLINLKTAEQEEETRYRIVVSRLTSVGFTLLAGIVVYYIFFPDEIKSGAVKYILSGVALIIVVSVSGLLNYRTRMLSVAARRNLEASKFQLQAQEEMSEIESQINQYRNLITTRSRELLIGTDRVLGR